MVHLLAKTFHLTSVISELEIGKSHNVYVSVYDTTHTLTHTCTHTVTTQLNPTGLGKKTRNCHERNMTKRNNSQPFRREETHADRLFITYLKPWLLPKQRNGASDLNKRRHSIIHVDHLHHKETEGERYSSMKPNVLGPVTGSGCLRPDTSQSEG